MNMLDFFKKAIGVEEQINEQPSETSTGFGSDGKDSVDATKLPIENSAKTVNNVMKINATTQVKVVLVKPTRYDDASGIADHLNQKCTVVLNLEETEKEESIRLIDFLSGVAYANNGQIKRVAVNTYIITPYYVEIMSDLLDELENSGVVF